MKPEWHSCAPESSDLPVIPFDRMWPDDDLWFPLMLAKKTYVGRVDFDKPPAGDAAQKMEDGAMRKWWFAEAQLTE